MDVKSANVSTTPFRFFSPLERDILELPDSKYPRRKSLFYAVVPFYDVWAQIQRTMQVKCKQTGRSSRRRKRSHPVNLFCSLVIYAVTRVVKTYTVYERARRSTSVRSRTMVATALNKRVFTGKISGKAAFKNICPTLPAKTSKERESQRLKSDNVGATNCCNKTRQLIFSFSFLPTPLPLFHSCHNNK